MLPGPLERGRRRDFTGIKINIDHHGTGEAQGDDLFQEERKNLFRPLSLKQTNRGGTALRGPAPRVDTFRLKPHLRGSHRLPQRRSLPAPASWPRQNRFRRLFFHAAFRELGPGYQASETHSIGVLQVSIYGGDYYTGLYSNEINTNQGNSHPSINYYAFV